MKIFKLFDKDNDCLYVGLTSKKYLSDVLSNYITQAKDCSRESRPSLLIDYISRNSSHIEISLLEALDDDQDSSRRANAILRRQSWVNNLKPCLNTTYIDALRQQARKSKRDRQVRLWRLRNKSRLKARDFMYVWKFCSIYLNSAAYENGKT